MQVKLIYSCQLAKVFSGLFSMIREELIRSVRWEKKILMCPQWILFFSRFGIMVQNSLWMIQMFPTTSQPVNKFIWFLHSLLLDNGYDFTDWDLSSVFFIAPLLLLLTASQQAKYHHGTNFDVCLVVVDDEHTLVISKTFGKLSVGV